MKYVVFTTKHHDGFSMFDTRLSDFKVTDPGCPHSRRLRPDIVKEVFEAFRAQGWGWGGTWTSAKDYQHFSAPGR